ncbi:MAG: DNA translocase FtsK 4TM domain-containing protein [Alphaproteobacteria bacterium]|nr:DNA translocase FtsK 4TM domain-containing protein [Alphaproteobacteria bacterium]
MLRFSSKSRDLFRGMYRMAKQSQALTLISEEDSFRGMLWRFLHARFYELLGITLLGLGLFGIFALVSFNATDPSLNHATDSRVANLGGRPGASAADLLLQIFGVASIVPLLAFLVWGQRALRRRPVRWPLLRFSLLMVALLAASGALSVFDAPESWPYASHLGLGGFVGSVLKTHFSPVLTWPGFLLTCLGLGFASLMLALEWSPRRVSWPESGMLESLRLWWEDRREARLTRKHEDAQEKASRSRFSFRRPQEEEEEDNDEDYEVSQEVSTAPRVQRAPKKPAPKAPRETQARLELDDGFELPPLSLLAAMKAKAKAKQISESALEQNARLLESVLEDFGVQGKITNIRPGPVVTLYELEPSPGTKSSRVIGLADDIARSMSAVSARIAVIPGKNAIGIELPNRDRETVLLRELMESEEYTEGDTRLPLALGKDIGGAPVIVDLAKMPHLLVAGTTGSGKSVAINTMILSLLYKLTPDECKFIMIDPKMLELSVYDGIPHLLSPVVTEPGKAVVALKWTVKEMENRYRLMSSLGVRNIAGYNQRVREAQEKGEELFRSVQTGFDPETGRPIIEKQPLDTTPLPLIVVIVDEMADLMVVAGKDIESSIQRLAQMARAAGIHIIMATQRPSVDVITGVIKANFPTRISFQVTSRIDSRTILGEQGAEQLLGQGDMLYMAGGGRITRVHGPFASDKEVVEVVSYLRTQGEPEYVEDITTDPDEEAAFDEMGGDSDDENSLYDRAVAIVLRDRKASTSYLQRKLQIGYNRAANLIERMEQEGVISQANHVGKREVLGGNN